MVNIENIENLLKEYAKLWTAIAEAEIATYVLPESYCILDTDYDGYDYSNEQMLYKLFGKLGNHEFVALYVPKEYNDRADECPLLFVDPETIDDNGFINGSTVLLGNLKIYLSKMIDEYLATKPSDKELLQQCNHVKHKIRNWSTHLLELPYKLKPYDWS
ncbi:MAG: hypothetical protein WD512_02140 [Candidatus Paceibacterota bacterium]